MTPTAPSPRKKKSQPESISLAGLAMLTTESKDLLQCEQVFELLDQFTERALRGEDVVHLMPLVAMHLERCPNCRQAYQVLKMMIEG